MKDQEVFQSTRLEVARDLRGKTGKEIADAAGISHEWFSAILRGRRIPQPETVKSFSQTLEVPEAFFFRSVEEMPPADAFHFRASSKLAKRDESVARGLSLIAMELCDWMNATYRLPSPDVPEIQELLDGDFVLGPEQAAEALRLAWGLGFKPVGNMLQLLESRGVRVFSAGGPLKNVDAFSFRHGETPVVFLNVHKTAERLRFDLAHELGHLLLHSGSLNPESSRQKEQEANDFASAFLMPRNDVLGAIGGSTSTQGIVRAKMRWGVSAMALAMRLYKLGALSEWVYRTTCQQLAAQGFRRSEPGSGLIPEVSSLLSQLLSDLKSRQSGYLEIANALDVRAQDVRDLMVGLTLISIEGTSQSTSRPSGVLRALN